MELRLNFDEERMRRYATRGASPLFEIHWAHQGTVYPAEDWMDFGAVILGWWLQAGCLLLQQSTEERFVFMEGPYELVARRAGELIHLTDEEASVHWVVPLKELIAELVRAADRVRRELLRLGIAAQQCDGLAAWIAEARAMSQV